MNEEFAIQGAAQVRADINYLLGDPRYWLTDDERLELWKWDRKLMQRLNAIRTALDELRDEAECAEQVLGEIYDSCPAYKRRPEVRS